MADLVRYTCPRDLLPCIEAALAANGYMVVESSHRVADDNVMVVMRCGAVQVLLAACPVPRIAAMCAYTARVPWVVNRPFGSTIQGGRCR